MENVFSHTAGTWTQGFSFLGNMLSVACQLLFCCPPLLMNISDSQFSLNPKFVSVVSYYCILANIMFPC